MNLYLMIFLQFFFGLISGIFGGLGMGGGTVLIPLLTIFLGFNQKLSQGLNLISFLPMSIISLLIHYKNGYLALNHIIWIILPGIIFSCLSSYLISYFPSNILRILFGIFLCFLSFCEFIRLLKRR